MKMITVCTLSAQNYLDPIHPENSPIEPTKAQSDPQKAKNKNVRKEKSYKTKLIILYT